MRNGIHRANLIEGRIVRGETRKANSNRNSDSSPSRGDAVFCLDSFYCGVRRMPLRLQEAGREDVPRSSAEV